MLNVAGVVVLYNPNNEINKNIISYVNQVEILYVVDNSEISGDLINYIINSHTNIVKVNKKNENVGIATALNLAAKRALKDGFDLLLTMDQDSFISENYVSAMAYEFERDQKIGVISGCLVHIKNPERHVSKGTTLVETAITSGSVIRLSAHFKVGGFLDRLFIDYVDHEYCLRMRINGYKIMLLNSAIFYHELGDVTPKRFFFMKVFPTNHSPIRWYYRTRNRFYLYRTYKDRFPDYIRFDKGVFIKEFFKIIIYEKEKIKKIKMIIKGYLDFKNNKFGKLTTL